MKLAKNSMWWCIWLSPLSSTETPVFYAPCVWWESYQHKDVSYLLITVFIQERPGAAAVCWNVSPHFLLLCFYNYTNAYLWGRSPHSDSEDHQPATSMDLSKAAGWNMHSSRFVTGRLKFAYTCSFSAFRMKNELPITVDMFRHVHMAEACSLLSPQLGTHQVWGRGVLARRKEEKGSSLSPSPFPCLCKLWAGGQYLSPLFPQQRSWARWSSQSWVPAHGRSLITLQAAGPDAAVFCSGPCWFTFLTPPLQLIWCYLSVIHSSSLCGVGVSPTQKMLNKGEFERWHFSMSLNHPG